MMATEPTVKDVPQNSPDLEALQQVLTVTLSLLTVFLNEISDSPGRI